MSTDPTSVARTDWPAVVAAFRTFFDPLGSVTVDDDEVEAPSSLFMLLLLFCSSNHCHKVAQTPYTDTTLSRTSMFTTPLRKTQVPDAQLPNFLLAARCDVFPRRRLSRE